MNDTPVGQCPGCGGNGGGGSAASGGIGGSGGVGGASGNGGFGDAPVIDFCVDAADRCTSLAIEPHTPCCENGVPDQVNACDGTESLENPASCTETGSRVFYRLTLLELEENCNVGYDLDFCAGETCIRGGLAPGEGVDGADNALAGLAPILRGIGGDFTGLNQAFSDALCGKTDSNDQGTCDGGDNDGQPCAHPDDCYGPDGRCDWADGDCLLDITPLQIHFVVDSNPAEGCANVTVLSAGEAVARVLNLSESGCLSGSLGTIPQAFSGSSFSFSVGRTPVQMSLSPAGFSHGLLGAVLDQEAAMAILAAVLPSSVDAAPGWWADITTPATDPATLERARCDGLSATFRIGGVAVDPREGGL